MNTGKVITPGTDASDAIHRFPISSGDIHWLASPAGTSPRLVLDDSLLSSWARVVPGGCCDRLGLSHTGRAEDEEGEDSRLPLHVTFLIVTSAFGE